MKGCLRRIYGIRAHSATLNPPAVRALKAHDHTWLAGPQPQLSSRQCRLYTLANDGPAANALPLAPGKRSAKELAMCARSHIPGPAAIGE